MSKLFYDNACKYCFWNVTLKGSKSLFVCIKITSVLRRIILQLYVLKLKTVRIIYKSSVALNPRKQDHCVR